MNVLLWLVTVEALSLAAFPLAFLVFAQLRDRGYALAKPLGLLLFAYPIWLAGSLGVPITRWFILAALVTLAGLGLLLARNRWSEMAVFLRAQWRLLLALEGVFLLIFLGWVALRAFDPVINHSEQLMDFAFVNGSVRADSYPPEDPWLRGHGLSYYYFGHLIVGLLTRLTGISSAVTYNLSLALVPAMASVGVLSLVVTLVNGAGASLRNAFFLGLGGVFLLGLVGNGEGLAELAHARGLGSEDLWGWLGIKGLEAPASGTSWFPQDGGWWWRATRVIDTVVDGRSLDYTIHEFPLFSFFLGDLHAHVMVIPFVLLAIGFAIQLMFNREAISLQWLRRSWVLVLLMGLNLGALGFINTWDLPLIFGLTLGLLVFKVYREIRTGEGRRSVFGGLALSLVLALLAGVLYLPFYLGLSTQVSGIRLVAEPVTRPVHFLLVWGAFVTVVAPFLLLQLFRARQRLSGKRATLAATLAVTPLVAWVGVALGADLGDQILSRLLHLAPALAVMALLLYRMLQMAEEELNPPLLVTLALLGFATLLLVGTELFYVGDFFSTRMNTVFKLYYQAWVVLAVVSPVCLYYGIGFVARGGVWPRLAGLAWVGLLAVPLLGGSYYAAGILADKVNGFRDAPTLDGLAYLKDEQTGEYAAIEWLWSNAQDGEALLEAVGDDYTVFSRISASTGLPTVLGWPGHEHQWRGSLEPQRGRAEDVAAIYQGTDVGEASRLLRKYDIQYVVVGPREEQRYGRTGLDTLSELLEPAFSQDQITIYRVKEGNG